MRSVADGGMNIMRIWGGGVYQLDAFYDAADEFGVLLYRTPPLGSDSAVRRLYNLMVLCADGLVQTTSSMRRMATAPR